MAGAEHDPAEWKRLSQQYLDYARFELATHGSPIYAAICQRLADDRTIGGLALSAQPGFRTPLILLAAVHRLLLGGLGHPLAAYYPSLVGADARPIDGRLYAAFADVVWRSTVICGHRCRARCPESPGAPAWTSIRWTCAAPTPRPGCAR